VRWSDDNPIITRPSGRQLVCRDAVGDALRALREASESGDAWAVYLAYDLGRAFEELPTQAADDLRTPWLGLSPLAPVTPLATTASDQTSTHATLRSTFTRDAYLTAVQRCIDYIAAGDVFQINLSQRFTAPLTRSPEAIFHDLQRRFPARYPAYLDFGDHKITSNSPELFLKVDRLPDGRRRIVNRPIKGTRPVGPGMHRALESSVKDRAELAMIVDLQRNDLGRICEIGTVRVTDPRSIETHPTVLHGVATVEGILREDVTLLDILRATFPCGSITGCPKIRAMQIIDEIEPVRRGVYCGAIGWFAPDGAMELSVAIRTMTVLDGLVYIPVGGGIVADSSPEAEYEETLVKARAMFAAAGVQLR
jgi:para-aminobenzoate synthetase component I